MRKIKIRVKIKEYKKTEELITELLKLTKEEYEAPSHYLTDSSVQHDDLCDEVCWYQEHFERISEIILELEKRLEGIFKWHGKI